MVAEVTQVHGLKELRKALTQTVPQHFRGQVLQKALTAGARIVLKDAQARAPQGKTGALKRALFMARDKSSSRNVYEQKNIGVRSGKREQKRHRDAWYWRFVEFGRGIVTAGERIRMRRGGPRNSATKARVLGTPATGFFGKRVKAAPARPFLRPAFDQNRDAALAAIRRSLELEIPKAAEKAKWRNLFRS